MNDKSEKSQRIAALLRDGMAAARAGRWAQARRFFEAVLRLDPRNEEAILWWAGLARDPHVTLAALTHLLEVNPRNQRARRGVRAARRQLPTRSAPSGSAATRHRAPQTTTSPSALRENAPQRPQEGGQEQASSRHGSAPTTADRRLNALFIGLALLIVAFSSALVAVVFPDAPQAVWAAFNPTATPTVTATATATPTASPTATPTASPTAMPTPTPSPTHTPSPTPTPAPTLALAVPPISSAPTDDKWIDIDLSDQRLVAYVGTVPVYAIRVSTGIPRFPTIKGQFHIYLKLPSTLMSGQGYYLPNVPWTMYYHKSFAIHGTYWHDNFGQPMSHGCVNLPTPDAKWLFDWTPQGTLVVVHD